MCGIAGFISSGAGSTAASRLQDRLRHRGPDADGVWQSQDGCAHFVHTRLAILDLSEAGSQPMRDEATGNVIVFNGEIYNHAEFREELQALGIVFRGHSDTETLLRGYGIWGTSLFARLRGMFAFAIYDARSREVVLCRDRFGIKPLYTGRLKDGGLAFASEVRALLPWVQTKVTPQGVAAFLQRGSCPHEQLLFSGVEEFPAGCWSAVRCAEPKLRAVRYWPMGAVDNLDIATDRADAPAEVRQLLEDAVASHLLADVPVACFLSGGIDSSIITALAARKMGAGKLSTFSVGFAEASFDESKFARQMADLYGTDHHHITLTDAEKLQFVSRAVEAMDLPSTDAINTFIVSDYVARNGFKVVLSGLGADEVFGGYQIFRDYSIARLLAGTPAWTRSLIKATGKGRHMFDDIPDEKDGEMLSMWWRRVWPAWRLRDLGLKAPKFAREPAPPLLDAMAELSWGEISHYMRDMLLRDSDAMSMAHSIELRVPFLDHPLVTRVLSYPARDKFNPGRPKNLLLRATQDLIPEQIWNRPKMGFTLPMRQWMLEPLADYCRQGLESLNKEYIISKVGSERAWKDFDQGRLHWPAAWALVVLGHYLEASRSRD